MQRHCRAAQVVARIGWRRAAVLGTAVLGTAVLGTAVLGASCQRRADGRGPAASGRAGALVAGAAGLAAGALSMAAGAYVSVASLADPERADIPREAAEIATDRAEELRALAGNSRDRGSQPALARQVAKAPHARDPLAAPIRDELAISAHSAARPRPARGPRRASCGGGAGAMAQTAAVGTLFGAVV